MDELPGGETVLEPALGIGAEDDFADDPVGIGERRLNGMYAEDEEAVIPLGVGASLTGAGSMAMPVVHVVHSGRG